MKKIRVQDLFAIGMITLFIISSAYSQKEHVTLSIPNPKNVTIVTNTEFQISPDTYVFHYPDVPKSVYGRNIEVAGIADGYNLVAVVIDGNAQLMPVDVEKDINNYTYKIVNADRNSHKVEIIIRTISH